ncbi:hypothetical protein LQ938_04880 [Microbacterium sp. cx-55]|uniref:hypothetical protein n=1 Tax=Microbacterium sp. cx-55 TaxID=2875948 RepID=UPI001CBDE91E|nr:hypothetical protein [Microbacterium sp. cx-55]MBZ4488545.1 hypothetical protein [Microbacterium sp. cx-55]UGB36128.1 hypothetical protein LQ938_04880 [Microbacterium sp. cx-55]
MDVNDEKLTSAEHAQMREVVTSGARRMRLLRARRRQTAAVAAAVVLVAAVVTGVSFAALRPDDRVAEPVETTSAPTPTVTPSPSVAPPAPQAPATAVQPYGGDCANMLSNDQASTWIGTAAQPIPQRWVDPGQTLSGGMVCMWSVPDAYLSRYVEIVAYPVSLFDATDEMPVSAGECVDGRCLAASALRDTWIGVSWTGASEFDEGPAVRSIGAVEFAELFDMLDESARAYPAPRAAERTSSWWPGEGCSVVSRAVSDEYTLSAPPGASTTLFPALDAPMERLGVDTCSFATGDATDLTLRVIPGAGYLIDDIAASEYATPVDVPGADAATLVPSNYVWEFNGNDLVVRSGDNLLIVAGYPTGDEQQQLVELIALATAALAAMNATLG